MSLRKSPQAAKPGGGAEGAGSGSDIMSSVRLSGVESGSAPPIKRSVPTVRDSRHLVVARRSWSYRLIRKSQTPAPPYGSQAWLALPDGDSAKVASVVIAAECWAQDGDDLPEWLEAELDAARAAHKLAEDREYVERAEAHRSEWSRRAPKGKSFTERRVQQLESAKARPGDYKGSGTLGHER